MTTNTILVITPGTRLRFRRGVLATPARARRALAALAGVLAVRRRHHRALVARQLDAAPQVRRDGRLVPALPEQGVDRLDLVPT